MKKFMLSYGHSDLSDIKTADTLVKKTTNMFIVGPELILRLTNTVGNDRA